MWQKALNLILGVYNLNDHRQIHRQAQDFGCVQMARFSETHRTMQHGSASLLLLARFFHNLLVERSTFQFVALSDKDPQEHRVFRQFHKLQLLKADYQSRWPTFHPSATNAKHRIVDTTMFVNALPHLPSKIRFQVCKLNEEKVVKPPQMPTTTNCFKPEAKNASLRCPSQAAANPMISEPTRFTPKVPHGKVSPNRSPTTPDNQKRNILPIAPPTNTMISAKIAIGRSTSKTSADSSCDPGEWHSNTITEPYTE